MIFDPGRRWREHGYKPDFAGILTYGGLPLTEEAAELGSFDVAIVGAPFAGLAGLDVGARWGPRAIRAAGIEHGPHLEAGWSSAAITPPRCPRSAPARPSTARSG